MPGPLSGEALDVKIGRDGLKSVLVMADSLRYSFAYPKIYLRPTDLSRAELLLQRFKLQGFVGVHLDFSDQAQKSIHLVCDELVLVGNEKYEFHNKNLEIHCRRLSFVEGSSDSEEDNQRVTFDLSAVNSQVLLEEEKLKDAVNPDPIYLNAIAPGLVHTKIFHWIVNYDHGKGNMRHAYPGADVPDNIGHPGKAGSVGGQFTLVVDEVDPKLLSFARPPIFIKTNGSQGGKGQGGGSGAQGGNGLVYDFPALENNDTAIGMSSGLRFLTLIYAGGQGGRGGHGGPGGRGGDGGAVRVFSGQDINLEKLVTADQAAGPDGEHGNDGKSGPRGATSTSNIYKSYGWKQLLGDIPEEDLRNMRDKIFEAWRGTEYIFPNTPEPANISNSERWQLYAEKGSQREGQSGTLSFEANAKPQVQSQLSYDANFLGLLIQRLNFEHFVHFTSQVSPTQDIDKMPELKAKQEAFTASFEWLNSVMDPLGERVTASSARGIEKNIWAEHILLCNKVASPSMVDAFRHSTKFVPWVPNMTIYTKIREDYRRTEAVYQGVALILQSNDKERAEAQGKIDEAQQVLRSSTAKFKSAQEDILAAETEFYRCDKDLEAQLKKLKDDMLKVEKELAEHVECGGDQVIDALSSVLMFDSSTKASVLGSALSIGSTIMRSYDQAVNTIGGVRKELLYGRMSYMKKTQDELKPGNIGRSIAAMKKDEEEFGEFRQQVVVNREDFEEMYKSVLTKMKAADDVRARFRSVLKTIDLKNKAVADYNQAFAGVAEQQLVIVGQEEFIQGMRHGAVNKLADDEIQVLDQFSTRIYHNMARFALWAIYGRARAYNCLSFRMSRIYDHMADLHCFSTLSADRLGQLDAIMTEDLVQLASEWNQNRSARTHVTLTLDDTNYQSRLEALRQEENPSLELDIDHQFFFKSSDGFKDHRSYDFRMYSMVVYLYGATLKMLDDDDLEAFSANEPHVLSATEERIMLRIKSHGKFRYRYPPTGGSSTDKFVTDIFEFSPSVTPFEYIHDKATGSMRCNARLASSEQLALDIDGGQGKRHEPIPLQSPMGAWSITPAKNVDTSKVHKVGIDFEVSYRVC
ncbi:hypothetical protein EDD21DRAFT_408455 [Dissophora ornata]|nr:hypothetical protein BGZ58_011045 [Dissophora ornata]KAI8596339.1 hypothetical protein EDD21DRAFT_408455 [Dissophora ornata]